jgi:phosphoribosylformylglycinamidine cyclo-ligase
MVTYKEAGVDIDKGNETLRRIKDYVKKTFNPNVILGIGSFGGALSLQEIKKMKDPVLVSSVDGVGTKLMIASKMNKWDSIGKDIVNHSVNDILAIGAKPLLFLDYVASEKLKPEIIEKIVKGLSSACLECGIPLIGGETAEMPGVYREGEYDLVGCIVGIVEKEKIIDGSNIRRGDVLIGLESNGLHTNGFSLARKVLLSKFSVHDYVEELGRELGEELLRPHRSYLREVMKLSKFEIKGIAHITGGGMIDNIPRIIPKGLGVEINKSKIRIPPIFRVIQRLGNVSEDEMFRTFNMGIGMILVIREDQAKEIVNNLKEMNLNSEIIGKVVQGEGVKFV